MGALARLGLARTYAMQGNTVKACAAYQDFLTLWKDADPDIPVLKQAKAEYASAEHTIPNLLETKTLDRVELRGFASRIEAKQNSHTGGEQATDGKDFRRELRWHSKETFN